MLGLHYVHLCNLLIAGDFLFLNTKGKKVNLQKTTKVCEGQHQHVFGRSVESFLEV